MKKTILPILIFFCFSLAVAQDNPADSTGIQPNYTYKSGINESINLFNGNLYVGVPLLSLKGRAGLDLNLNLSYNSRQFKYWTDDLGQNQVAPIEGDNTYTANFGNWLGNFYPQITEWSVGDEYGCCTRYAEITLETGAKTYFVEDYGYGSGYANDGTRMKYDFDHKVLYTQSGIWYDFSQTSNFIVKKGDANGNVLEFHYNANWRITQIIDTLGRTINFYYDPLYPWSIYNYYTATRMTVLNNNGAILTYSFEYQFKVVNITPYGYTGDSLVFQMLSRINLPDGTNWIFDYYGGYPNASGSRLQKITYPSGGYTRYEYGHNYWESGLDYYINKKVVNANNSQGEIATQYSAQTLPRTVFNPDGSYESHYFWNGVEGYTYYYDATGNALKYESYSWNFFEPYRGTKLGSKWTYNRQPSGQWAMYDVKYYLNYARKVPF